MADALRRARAQTRSGRIVLRKGRLQPQEADLSPIDGPDAIALVETLTAESWSLAGKDVPSYTRDGIPCRFVPRRPR
jgi:hypothetical protein